MAELSARVDDLAKAGNRALGGEFAAMTKMELQAYAEERGITGVDQNRQTKDEMIEAIRRSTDG